MRVIPFGVTEGSGALLECISICGNLRPVHRGGGQWHHQSQGRGSRSLTYFFNYASTPPACRSNACSVPRGVMAGLTRRVSSANLRSHPCALPDGGGQLRVTFCYVGPRHRQLRNGVQRCGPAKGATRPLRHCLSAAFMFRPGFIQRACDRARSCIRPSTRWRRRCFRCSNFRLSPNSVTTTVKFARL